MSQINITRYPAPYTSECVSDWGATNYSDFLPWGDFYYTLSQCQRFCLQSSFQQLCGCYHPYFLDYDANRRGKQACDLETDDAACTDDVVYLLDQAGITIHFPYITTFRTSHDFVSQLQGELECNCGVECEQTEYITQSSQAVWPSEQYFNQAMVEYGFRDGTGQPQVDDNLLMVQVYFTSLNVQRVQESPTYQASRELTYDKHHFTLYRKNHQFADGSLMSSLGGAISLYLGIALAMIFEVIELFIDFIINVIDARDRQDASGRSLEM